MKESWFLASLFLRDNKCKRNAIIVVEARRLKLYTHNAVLDKEN